MGTSRKAVTIRDIAQAAGVSASTVSRALSRPGRISADTAKRIRLIADELGYHVDPIEPYSAMGGEELNGMLAITVADISNPVFADYVKSAQHECLRKGFGLAVVDAEETGTIERAAMQLMHRHVDGFVLASSRASDATIRKLAEIKPVVSLNRPTRGIQSIVADPSQGLNEAIDHLAALGHRTITYLAGPASSWQDSLRWRTITSVGERHGMRLRRLPCPSPTRVGGRSAARTFVEHPTSAVIAYNDVMAIGFVAALKQLGVAVPAEVSVVGIDDLALGTIITPQLSSVQLPRRALAERAVDELVARLHHSTRAPSFEPVLYPSSFVDRESTAVAKR